MSPDLAAALRDIDRKLPPLHAMGGRPGNPENFFGCGCCAADHGACHPDLARLRALLPAVIAALEGA